jgi:hypothetical protein
VCNRFDYGLDNDQDFFNLLRDIPNRKNVYIMGNTMIENIYSKQLKNVDIGNFIIKPLGINTISYGLEKKYNVTDEDKYFIPVYHNETLFMDLSKKMNELGIKNNNGIRFKNHISDLLEYKGIICIPYAWSTIAFFEVLQLGLIYFIPSISFLIEMSKTPNFWFQPPYNADPNRLATSEWYCNDHKGLLIYFDSWDDLLIKLKTTNYEEQTRKILNYANLHSINTLMRWENIITDYKLKHSITE